MKVLPDNFSIMPIWQGVNEFINNLMPLAILLITIILGFFVLEKVIDLFKKKDNI